MNSNKLHIFYLIIIVLLIAGMIGEYYYFHNKVAAMSMGMPSGGSKMAMMGGKKGGMPRMGGMAMAMIPVTPPPLSSQQSQQVTDGTSKATTDKTFNITGGNFYFVPNKITVNQGDKVTLIMTNAGGIHDLVIDALGIKTPLTHTADAATVTFTATKKGSFVYYCSVPTHKARGMWGTLTVQ